MQNPLPDREFASLLQRRNWLTTAAGLSGWLGLAALGGCASSADPAPAALERLSDALPPSETVTPFSGTAVGSMPFGWQPYAMRRDLKPTQYSVVRDGEHRVLHASATGSATGLRCAVQIDPARFNQLQFSWRAHQISGRGDVAVAEHDDCPARLILSFAGDDTRLPLRDRLFFEQVELFTGQRLPFATLMYVWDGGRHALESVHRNHRSTRIQYLTVESGERRCGHWLHYQRDVVADYQRVFGEAPGMITGVGVLTDADALKIDTEAWYGDISLSAAAGPSQATTRPNAG